MRGCEEEEEVKKKTKEKIYGCSGGGRVRGMKGGGEEGREEDQRDLWMQWKTRVRWTAAEGTDDLPGRPLMGKEEE